MELLGAASENPLGQQHTGIRHPLALQGAAEPCEHLHTRTRTVHLRRRDGFLAYSTQRPFAPCPHYTYIAPALHPRAGTCFATCLGDVPGAEDSTAVFWWCTVGSLASIYV